MLDGLLGEVMVRMGMIGRERIDEALLIQRATGARFGEAMVETGAITWEQLNSALSEQKQLL